MANSLQFVILGDVRRWLDLWVTLSAVCGCVRLCAAVCGCVRLAHR
jgi:hypothetical protein